MHDPCVATHLQRIKQVLAVKRKRAIALIHAIGNDALADQLGLVEGGLIQAELMVGAGASCQCRNAEQSKGGAEIGRCTHVQGLAHTSLGAVCIKANAVFVAVFDGLILRKVVSGLESEIRKRIEQLRLAAFQVSQPKSADQKVLLIFVELLHRQNQRDKKNTLRPHSKPI